MMQNAHTFMEGTAELLFTVTLVLTDGSCFSLCAVCTLTPHTQLSRTTFLIFGARLRGIYDTECLETVIQSKLFYFVLNLETFRHIFESNIIHSVRNVQHCRIGDAVWFLKCSEYK